MATTTLSARVLTNCSFVTATLWIFSLYIHEPNIILLLHNYILLFLPTSPSLSPSLNKPRLYTLYLSVPFYSPPSLPLQSCLPHTPATPCPSDDQACPSICTHLRSHTQCHTLTRSSSLLSLPTPPHLSLLSHPTPLNPGGTIPIQRPPPHILPQLTLIPSAPIHPYLTLFAKIPTYPPVPRDTPIHSCPCPVPLPHPLPTTPRQQYACLSLYPCTYIIIMHAYTQMPFTPILPSTV